jgi:hypothetical protein
MKYLTYIIIAAALVTACSGKPIIKFEETSFNFGDTKADQQLKHTFKFQNVGRSTLIIKKVKAG